MKEKIKQIFLKLNIIDKDDLVTEMGILLIGLLPLLFILILLTVMWSRIN